MMLAVSSRSKPVVYKRSGLDLRRYFKRRVSIPVRISKSPFKAASRKLEISEVDDEPGWSPPSTHAAPGLDRFAIIDRTTAASGAPWSNATESPDGPTPNSRQRAG